MRVITWNANSIKARHDRLLALLARHQPDALCIQELKVEAEAFPHAEVLALGYHSAVHGQRTYNGVALLAREMPTDVTTGFGDGGDDSQSRFIVGTVNGVRVASAYFPNGGDPASEKYAYKLEWMKRMSTWVRTHVKASDAFALTGDFNVAPDDSDVRNPDSWRDTVLCRAEVRAALEAIRDAGLVDVFRKHNPQGGVYSWWDYRQLGFPKNDGLRIDHIFTTPKLADLCTGSVIDREERKGKLPSDHAPVIAEFAV